MIADKLLTAALSSGEKLVVVYDNFMKEVADGFLKRADYSFNLDEFGKRPLKEVPSEIISAVKKSQLLLLLVSKQGNEHTTVRKPLIDMKYSQELRVGAMYDVTKKQFEEVFSYDPLEVKELNVKLMELVLAKDSVRIETPAGTDLKLKIDHKYKWINQDADLSKVSLQHSLLAGEVYGYPVDVNGVMVVDGVMGGEFSRFSMAKPLTIFIEDSKIVSIRCDNLELEQAFEQHILKYENADRIGELGFGTNIALTKLYGVLGIDEKFPGNHIAFGHPYAEKTGAEWTCEVHVDCVMKKCSTWIGDIKVLEEGKYLI